MDAEGDCLLVKDAWGGTNIIGWNEIVVVFGAKHNDKEDFRSIKVMLTTLDKYNPRAYLLASVEHNPNKKLVSGQPYEEVLYYKDAAPYGPTYHLMTTMAELFWSAGRSNRFLTPMILAYLRSLHGHGYNWAKAILHGLWNVIHFMQSRARSNEGGKPIPVVWAPCFLHILFGLRRNLFVETPLEEAEGWLPSTERQSAKELSAAIRRDISQVINSRLLPYVQARIQRHIAATDTWKKAYEVELSKTELEETKRSSEASIKRLEEEALHLREALAAKESVVQAIENARHKEISTLKATCQKYKTSLDGEIGTNADLQARVLNLQDELSTCKYTQEQALQGQKSARTELLEVKKELRMLQVLHQDVDEGNAASAP
ncbi:hypothetical protein R1flu_028095 [Riccia fluitans]|uniref:Uncharacterized protein n=1 Tax=Riccia fluitans TaxID=41844 RepID=A0ABD1XKR4_9MARC